MPHVSCFYRGNLHHESCPWTWVSLQFHWAAPGPRVEFWFSYSFLDFQVDLFESELSLVLLFILTDTCSTKSHSMDESAADGKDPLAEVEESAPTWQRNLMAGEPGPLVPPPVHGPLCVVRGALSSVHDSLIYFCLQILYIYRFATKNQHTTVVIRVAFPLSVETLVHKCWRLRKK